jgi:hypothetical protein
VGRRRNKLALHEHERRQRQQQWERDHASSLADDSDLRRRYQDERAATLAAFMASTEGRKKYQEEYPAILALHKAIDPDRCHMLAHEAALERVAPASRRGRRHSTTPGC